jgi:hypothetical protein
MGRAAAADARAGAGLPVDRGRAELTQRMARCQTPGPLWGCDPALPSARLDRKGIDPAIDRASMIPINDLAVEEELHRAFGTGRYAHARR